MKIRNGFVSNSSSASFVLIGSTLPKDSPNYGRTFTRTSTGASGNSTVHNDYDVINVYGYEGETNLCRSDIMWISTKAGKIWYIIAIYAKWYENDPDYFRKVLDARDKISELARKHWYSLKMTIPSLCGYYEKDWDEEKKKLVKTDKIQTCVNIYTECTYSSKIVEMIEDDDTSLLDRFIFSDHSFCVLGGDEYDETYALQREAVDYLNKIRKDNPDFSYVMFADYEDHDKDDVWVDSQGVEHKWGYDSHWEKDCFTHENWDDDEEERVGVRYL